MRVVKSPENPVFIVHMTLKLGQYFLLIKAKAQTDVKDIMEHWQETKKNDTLLCRRKDTGWWPWEALLDLVISFGTEHKNPNKGFFL